MQKIILLLLLLTFFTYSNAQKIRSDVNGYGHMNYNLTSDLNTSNDPMERKKLVEDGAKDAVDYIASISESHDEQIVQDSPK